MGIIPKPHINLARKVLIPTPTLIRKLNFGDTGIPKATNILWQGRDLNTGSFDPEDDTALPTTITCLPGMELLYLRLPMCWKGSPPAFQLSFGDS